MHFDRSMTQSLIVRPHSFSQTAYLTRLTLLTPFPICTGVYAPDYKLNICLPFCLSGPKLLFSLTTLSARKLQQAFKTEPNGTDNAVLVKDTPVTFARKLRQKATFIAVEAELT